MNNPTIPNNRWCEINEELSFAILRSPRPKRVAQKIGVSTHQQQINAQAAVAVADTLADAPAKLREKVDLS
jgi:hypothetical protein